MCLLPDELQAQQLVIDAFTQCLLREREYWLECEWDSDDKVELKQQRRYLLRQLIGAIVELGVRRAAHTMVSYRGDEHKAFYQLEVRTRAVAWLRFTQRLSLEEIEQTLGLKRHEVVEKVHNARFMLQSQPPHWTPVQEGRP